MRLEALFTGTLAQPTARILGGPDTVMSVTLLVRENVSVMRQRC